MLFTMRNETEANRRLWDEWTRHHLSGHFYGVDAVRRGASTLTSLERDELGSVAGKEVLHLQCHFGLDTLSLARLGAHATGVDFSPVAIQQARALTEELGVSARFVCGELDDTLPLREAAYDIVFTSYGVLSWLPELDSWEFHPVLGMLDDSGTRFTYPYCFKREPIITDERASYGGAEHPPMTCYQWSHDLGEVVTALADVGLHIDFLREFPYTMHQCYPFLIESEPGRYVVEAFPGVLPLLFSIKASRPAR
jgi:SAM-dependent methyltransferase